jgi:hypothetical protein
LNKPIEHYGEMVTIFGNILATEKFAKGSSEPLGTQVTKNEDECDEVNASPVATIRTPEDNGVTTSMPNLRKQRQVAMKGRVG